MNDDSPPDQSKPKGGPRRPASPQPSSDPSYEVGYRKPPVEHRFKKGEPTPNRWGRGGSPEKAQTLNKPRAFGREFTGELGKAIVIEEAYRPVKIREDGKAKTLPMVAALVRSLGLSGLKGNRVAAKALIGLVQTIEAERAKDHAVGLREIEKYKRDAQGIIARARKDGLAEPNLLPHPDDLLINERTGVVTYAGPTTAQEKARWDLHLARRDVAQEDVSYCAAGARNAREPALKAIWLEGWLEAQKAFDLFNDNLPPRYRTKLKDRSDAEGASRPASQKYIDWPEA